MHRLHRPRDLTEELSKEIVDALTIKDVVNAVYDDKIMTAIWNKALVNCCLNPLGAIKDMTGDLLCKDKESIDTMRCIAKEVEEVAKAYGIDNVSANNFFEKMLPNIANGPANYPSMANDVHNKRKTEIDQLNGFVMKLGKELNIKTPCNERIVMLVHAIDNNY